MGRWSRPRSAIGGSYTRWSGRLIHSPRMQPAAVSTNVPTGWAPPGA